jgi:uncharacterized membrane protein YkvA (DUF1232 family)
MDSDLRSLLPTNLFSGSNQRVSRAALPIQVILELMRMIDSLKQRSQTLRRDTMALWYAFQDWRTPWYAKAFSIVVVAYALSPIDLIPDFIPILGYLDDLILIPAGIALTLKMIPPEVMNDASIKATSENENSKLPGKIMGIIIIVLWLMVAFFIGRAIYQGVKK